MYFHKLPKIVSKLFPEIVWSKGSRTGKVYLSFDDGPHPESTPLLLELLEKYRIKASFFCLGERIEKYPHLFQELKQEGHVVANHGYKHLNGWKTNTEKYIENFRLGKEISGSEMFRPPYGKLSLQQYTLIKNESEIVMWNRMPGDFDKNLNTVAFEKKLIDSLKPGNIVCLHDELAAVKKLYSTRDCFIGKEFALLQ